MIINGESKSYSIQSITSLLAYLTLKPNHIVIEVNGEIVDKSKYDDRLLKQDDKIEIISFVGGG